MIVQVAPSGARPLAVPGLGPRVRPAGPGRRGVLADVPHGGGLPLRRCSVPIMALATRFTELSGCRVPIQQAPMGPVSTSALAVAVAAEQHPQLLARSISPHTFRHTTAMHMLQSGVDMTVIALWLGHESPSTTHMYVEADLVMKERALARLKPPEIKPARYRPPKALMQFLQSL